MSALLAVLLGNKALLGFLASVIAALCWGFHQRLAGAKASAANRRPLKPRRARSPTRCRTISAHCRRTLFERS